MKNLYSGDSSIYLPAGHRVNLVGSDSEWLKINGVQNPKLFGASPVRLLSSPRKIKTISWTELLPPIDGKGINLLLQSRCNAPLLVTRIAIDPNFSNIQPERYHQLKDNTCYYMHNYCLDNGEDVEEKVDGWIHRQPYPIFFINNKNGILLTTNPAKHTGWIIVEAWCEHKSPRWPLRGLWHQWKSIRVNLEILPSCLTNTTPVKKYTLPKGPWLNDMEEHKQG